MSVLFTEKGQEVWEVSNATGKLAVAHVRAIADLLGLPSGLSEITADEVEVDPQALLHLVEAASDYLRYTQSNTFVELFRLPLIVAVGLSHRTSTNGAKLAAIVGDGLVAEGERLVK